MKLWKCFALAVSVVIVAILLGYVVDYLQERDMAWVLGLISVVGVMTGFIWLATHY